jgi:hypothetical protein
MDQVLAAIMAPAPAADQAAVVPADQPDGTPAPDDSVESHQEVPPQAAHSNLQPSA